MAPASTKTKAFKFPKSLGACLARLAELQGLMKAATARAKPLADEDAALRDFLLNTFKKDELDGAKGAGISISVVPSVVPTLKDWQKFLKFAMRAGNDDLLQRSVNTPAWRARVDAKKPVPGVEPFRRVSLRVNKAKGKKT